MRERERTIGIDLGTTNSVVASTDGGGEPRVLPDEHDEKIHPSVVSFHPNGTVIVGAVAKQRRVIDPANTVYSVKRLIGRPFNSPEVQAAKTRMPFYISEGQNEQPVIHTRGGQFAIPEISAIVLDHMRAIAKRAQRSDIAKAVITVPANFSEGQRSATATAGAIAGLEVIQILNEPTAAALAYGHRKNLDRLIAVYDFGGGTFDITLLQIRDHVYEVIATAGNSFLGGDDIDETLVEHMVELFLREQSVDLRTDDLAMQRLRSVAEQIKIQLSRRNRAIIKIDEIAYGPGGRGLDLNLEINRDELIARCAHVVDRTFPVCDEALKLAGIARDQITDVVLVGGTTKMPYVRQRATQYFGSQPRVDVNPDEAVALGASLQADIIARELAGEPVRRRTGTMDTKSEVTRVDERVGQRVAQMIRATEARRASAPSSSVVIEDEEMTFSEEYTDGSGIFITVDPDELSESDTRTIPTTRSPSEVTHPLVETESNTLTSAEDWATDSGNTDEGWDAPWSAQPLAAPAAPPQPPPPRRPSEATAKAGPDTLRQFGQSVGRTTDRGHALPPPLPRPLPGPDSGSGDDLPTLSRGEPASLQPLAPENAIPLERDELKPFSRTSPPSPHQPFREPDVSNKSSRPLIAQPPPAPPTASQPPPRPPVPAAPPSARTMFETPSQQLGPQLYDPKDLQRRGNPPPLDDAPSIPALYDPKGLQNQPPSPPAPQPPPPAPPPPAPRLDPPPHLEAKPPMPFGSDPGPSVAPPRPADSFSMTEPAMRSRRDSVSQYGVPELGSKPFLPPMVKDVTSYALGIGTVAGFCESLIARNTPVPHEVKKRFSTSQNNQTTVRIKVYQGESRRLDQNRRLGDLVLDNLPPRPRGETSIDVSFVLNDSGMLEVHAVDVATGYQQSASIEIRGAQSADEVAASQERMRKMFQ